MHKLFNMLVTVSFLVFLTSPALSQETATPQEVYDMVIKAAYLVEQLGDEGLAAFNDPKGEFAWKDSYIFVSDCAAGTIAAHPNTKVIGMSSAVIRCKKRGNLILKEACEIMSTEKGIKQGNWYEYWWDKPGSDTPQRKISFMVHVPSSKYQVAAGIYDDNITVEELNKTLR